MGKDRTGKLGPPANLYKYDKVSIEDGYSIKKEGYFDLEKLNKIVIKFLKEYKYSGKWTSNQTIKDLPKGREGELVFESKRKVDQYHKYVMNVTFYLFHVKDVVVEKNGKQKKLQHGIIDIVFRPYFEKNWGVDSSMTEYQYEHGGEEPKKVLKGSKHIKKSMFGKSPFDKFLKYVYDRYIIKGQTFSHFGGLRKEVQELANRLKKELDTLNV